MGLVAYRGGWRSPDTVSAEVKADEDLARRLAEYNARRGRAAMTADAQWDLVLWCEKNGLDAEAKAHLTTVVRLDPAREAAWKRLGCKKVGNRWISAEQLAAEKAELEAQKQADKRWRPLLAKYRDWLAGKDETKRAEAEKALGEINDPRAVPAVWAVFARGDERSQARAVQVLGQIEGVDASRALAALAVFSPSGEVRRVATETLRNRDIRDVVGWLIALIRKPLKYEVRPVGGPGAPGALFVAGQKFNVQRLYEPPPMPAIPLFPGEPITYDAAGLPVVSRMLALPYMMTHFQPLPGPHNPQLVANLPVVRPNPSLPEQEHNQVGIATMTPVAQNLTIPIGQIMLQYQAAAASSAAQLQSDIAAVEAFNAGVAASNTRVVGVLQALTGQDLDDDQQAWARWWADQQGYVYRPTPEVSAPTMVQEVLPVYQPTASAAITQTQAGAPTSELVRISHSCFRAGTPVRTLTGPCQIESVTVGDRVLVEDPVTGALSYQSVLAVFHNRPAKLYRIDLGGESLWATGIHRFWKAGKGWAMARDLKAGDVLRTLGGTARVDAVAEGPVEPVYNLEVADGQSFFVGDHGALVHDNSLVRPVAEPFDAGTLASTSNAPRER
jgi:hypothetical protein